MSDELALGFAALAIFTRQNIERGELDSVAINYAVKIRTELIEFITKYNDSLDVAHLKEAEKSAKILLVFWKNHIAELPSDEVNEFKRLDSVLRRYDGLI